MRQTNTQLDDCLARLVMFAYGNPSRGDDALGPELLRRLEEDPAYQANLYKSITDFQLQIEHAQDLLHRDLALFVDASMTSPPPFSFYRLSPRRDISYTSHAMSPAAVLYGFEQAYGRTPPPAFMLSIRGEDFTLGHPVSAAAGKYLDAALEFAKRLVLRPDSECWNNCAERF